MIENESILLTNFLKGDKAAFAALFKAYYQDACRYVIRLIRDEDTAEEIVQTTLVNIWEKREMINEDISFKSYLFRSAYNTALNYLKHQKVVANYANLQKDTYALNKERFVSQQPDFELQRRVKAALSDLPPQCQRVFRMSREEGLKYHEIADELGISKKTVEVHMGKALKLLREALSDYLPIMLTLLLW